MAADGIELIGHNKPPDDIAILLDRIERSAEAITKRRDELIGSFGRAPAVIETEDQAAKVADLVSMISKCAKSAEAMRENEKAPFLSGGSAVDSFFHKNFHVKGAKTATAPLDIAKSALEKRLTDYQRAKADEERKAREAEAQRQREEAEKAKREAEEAAKAMQTDEDLQKAIAAENDAKQAQADVVQADRAAGAKPAELSRVRGDFGALSSLHTWWDHDSLDRDKIDLEALRPYLAIADIEKAVRGYIKANFTTDKPGEQITGVRIFQNSESRVR